MVTRCRHCCGASSHTPALVRTNLGLGGNTHTHRERETERQHERAHMYMYKCTHYTSSHRSRAHLFSFVPLPHGLETSWLQPGPPPLVFPSFYLSLCAGRPAFWWRACECPAVVVDMSPIGTTRQTWSSPCAAACLLGKSSREAGGRAGFAAILYHSPRPGRRWGSVVVKLQSQQALLQGLKS